MPWCISLLLATTCLRAAEVPPQRFDFDLPAERLELALQRFNAQSGAAAGMSGALPDIETRAVVGRYTALEALQRMIAGRGIEVVALDAASFRLQRTVVRTPASGNAPLTELSEVLVTATKRSQSLPDLPVPITVVDAERLASGAPLGGTRAALDFDAATSSTNLGPGRNRHFIRGVADSAFLGPSQATVSIQFDEARLNYNAPDPDLRLLDVERVEILKGPQGPLYGTGALGGVLHILPQRPDLAATTLRAALFAGDIAHGGVSSGASAVLNLPLVPDAVGVRAVAYAEDAAGWIDNAGGRSDANGAHVGGGRLALRAQGDAWLFDLQGAAQHGHVLDSQYVPGTAATLTRSGVLPEPRDNDMYLLSGTLRGALWGGELVFTSSYVRQEVDGLQDASAAASLFDASAPLRYDDDRAYHLFGTELRFSRAVGEGLSWLVGLAQQTTGAHIAGRLDPPPASGATVLDLHRDSHDFALFGESAVALPASLRLTAGLRVARVSDEDERSETDMPSPQAAVMYTTTPSLSLDWRSPDERRLVYLRYAQAVRPGGLNPDSSSAEEGRFRSDELASLDAGVRLRLAGDALALQSALFATRWRHVQSDYLQDDGLIGTRNVGNAGNVGLETQLRFTGTAGWSAELGTVLQRARLDDPALPAAGEDPRLPVVPDFRAYSVVAREFALGGWRARLQARADYTGSSRLSFDPDLDRETPASFTLAAGARFTRGGYELQLNATNLLDSRADTFAFGNPFSIRAGPQRTPLQPRTLTLQLAYVW